MRDERVEPREADAYLKQYVEVVRGEPAHLAAESLQPSLSQRRMLSCSRSHHE
jgi:hypothetical protein